MFELLKTHHREEGVVVIGVEQRGDVVGVEVDHH